MKLALLGTIAIALGSLAACSAYHVTSNRLGAVYTSKGPSCDLKFENLSFQEASSRYQQIGMVTLTGTGDEFTDAQKKDVEREACKIGGDAATLNASAPGMFQFLVWRKSS